MKPQYPVCRTVDKVEDWFGHSLADPYAWLKDAKDPEVLDFVARENACTDAFFPSDALERKIAELKAGELPKLPSRISPWGEKFLASMEESGDYRICVLDGGLREAGTFTAPPALDGLLQFEATACPKCGDIVAVMAMKPGAPRLTIEVCRLSDQTVLHEADMVFSGTWSKVDGCLYYSKTDADSEAQTSVTTLYRYDPIAQEETVAHRDERCAIFGQESVSHDGAWLLAALCCDYSKARWVAVDCRTQKAYPLNEEPAEWVYLDSLDGAHYFISMDGASHGKVIKVGADGTVADVLPESDKRILESGFSAGGEIFLICREDVSAHLYALSGREIPLPAAYGDLASVGRGEGQEFLKFESFTTPPAIYAFSGEGLAPVCRSAEDTHPDVVVEQFFAPSTGDQTPIPYYLVRRRDHTPTGSHRVLMYGYGGYNINMPPSYLEMVSQLPIARFVEGGGIFVQCGLRGGNEYGSAWHEAGMGMAKRHCYEDFIGIAEALIRDGWTQKGRIGIVGCSNGGLLMSALVTMRPDLWGCVLDSVPHTDMIHFAEDDRGPMYITEYGNPRESEEMFSYLLSYSPYHNIRNVPYPPTYIQTGELDNNVPPYHGKKFAARMQASTTGDAPILLRVLAEGSHDRGKGEAFYRTIAEMHLFLQMALGG